MTRVLLAYCLLAALSAHALDFDQNEMVVAHNRWRKAVGAPPLTYSTDLAAAARIWANHLRQDNLCQMQHSKPEGKYGENLYWASAVQWSDGRRELQKIDPKAVVDAWGNERADYDYRNNSCVQGKMCGHYTQMVWKTTTAVGCGAAECEDTHDQVWVCRYQPPGNWIGKNPY